MAASALENGRWRPRAPALEHDYQTQRLSLAQGVAHNGAAGLHHARGLSRRHRVDRAVVTAGYGTTRLLTRRRTGYALARPRLMFQFVGKRAKVGEESAARDSVSLQ